jgi:hypothetical protein
MRTPNRLTPRAISRLGPISALAAALVIALPAAPAVASTTVPELDRPAVDEFTVDGAPGLVVWAYAPISDPFNSNAYARYTGEHRFQLNPTGTAVSFVGTDGATAVYTIVNDRGLGDLQLYDLATGSRSEPSEGINTKADENWPTISGDWLMFVRNRVKHGLLDVILANVSTGERRILAEGPNDATLLESGQIDGDWATYIRCSEDVDTFTASDCQVERYEISTEETTELPNPGSQQFGAMVTADGTVYYSRNQSATEWDCGAGSQIVRVTLDGSETILGTVDDGYADLWGRAVTEPDGSVTLHFYRVPCDFHAGGIWKLTVAAG